jgi:hypothetical protein
VDCDYVRQRNESETNKMELEFVLMTGDPNGSLRYTLFEPDSARPRDVRPRECRGDGGNPGTRPVRGKDLAPPRASHAARGTHPDVR